MLILSQDRKYLYNFASGETLSVKKEFDSPETWYIETKDECVIGKYASADDAIWDLQKIAFRLDPHYVAIDLLD